MSEKPSLPDQPRAPDHEARPLPVVFQDAREGPQHLQPCSQCPFARNVTDECLIAGGSPPEVYVGQAWGPFLLPCHMDPTYDPYTAGMQTLQCAGAAIFRANCGLKMPSAFIKAVIDTDKVFATPAELIAHHRHITIEAAEKILRKKPPGILLAEELHRAAQSARGKLILTPTKE